VKAVSIYPAGEQTLTVSFGGNIDAAINDRVFRLYHYMCRQPNPFWTDLIPAYSTLTVVYKVDCIREHHTSAFLFVKDAMEHAINASEGDELEYGRMMQIPVCYDSIFGFDLKSLSKVRNVSVDKLIELHTTPTYRVYMLGFLPGFPYMGSVNKKIASPRLASPHKLVPAGSVGIAGNQTGIYPLDSPGGWNIIGRTPVKLFDAGAEVPVLFQPGYEVKFYAITKEEFNAFNAAKFNPYGQ
jgi:inhibitor of KinA